MTIPEVLVVVFLCILASSALTARITYHSKTAFDRFESAIKRFIKREMQTRFGHHGGPIEHARVVSWQTSFDAQARYVHFDVHMIIAEEKIERMQS